MKEIIRKILLFLHLDITKNLEYDRLTMEIFKKHLKSDSNCIDVGCHKGEILDEILKLAPQGKHFAFEPIPNFYKSLDSKYSEKVTLFNCALADETGETTFNYVKNAPAYSGIKQRKYAVSNPDIEKLNVKLEKLDDLIPQDQQIDLIKIDVEGAEFGVLKGGKELISKNKPLVLFEFGLGASDFYGTQPEDIFNYFKDCEMEVFTLKGFIQNDKALNSDQFKEIYLTNKDYYFVGK
ncbi:MAG: FkbM family methyltransferase [Crocinitomicaceae bacterium]|nr:FkbM family methyltransferase [Crocinitomicaceae bacterium]